MSVQLLTYPKLPNTTKTVPIRVNSARTNTTLDVIRLLLLLCLAWHVISRNLPAASFRRENSNHFTAHNTVVNSIAAMNACMAAATLSLFPILLCCVSFSAIGALQGGAKPWWKRFHLILYFDVSLVLIYTSFWKNQIPLLLLISNRWIFERRWRKWSKMTYWPACCKNIFLLMYLNGSCGIISDGNRSRYLDQW